MVFEGGWVGRTWKTRNAREARKSRAVRSPAAGRKENPEFPERKVFFPCWNKFHLTFQKIGDILKLGNFAIAIATLLLHHGKVLLVHNGCSPRQ